MYLAAICAFDLPTHDDISINRIKNEQKVGMLLQKRTDTRGVRISSMRKINVSLRGKIVT